MASSAERPTGAKTKTNDVVLSSQVLLLCDSLRDDVIERHARGIEDIAPPTFRRVLSHVCRKAMPEP